MYLDNRQKAARFFFAMRKGNIKARSEEYIARLVALKEERKARLHSLNARAAYESAYAEYRRYVLPEVRKARQAHLKRLANLGAPKRLGPSEFDAATGSVRWQLLFQEHHQFAADRARIDTLFTQRTPYNSGASSRNYVEVQKATERMKVTLRAMQRRLDPATYVAAKEFLTSLANEARFPVPAGPAQVAAK